MQNTMLDSTISNSLQLFADKGFKIRVIMRCSDPWFVAKDVATCIEHKDVTTMCRLCRDKDKVVVNYAELKHSADLAECFSEQQSPNQRRNRILRYFAVCDSRRKQQDLRNSSL